MLRSFKDKNFYHPLIIWLIIVIWYFLFFGNLVSPLSRKTQDIVTEHAYYFFSRPPHEAEHIVVVAIDELSRQTLGRKWPWQRSVTAELLQEVASFKPKVIGLDIIFSGISSDAEDKALVSALKSHPAIVLAHRVGKGVKDLPHKRFQDVAASLGFVNKPVDTDEVVRNTRLFYMDDEGAFYTSMDIELVARFLGVVRTEYALKGTYFLLKDKSVIPTREGITPLNYVVHKDELTTVPAFLVLQKKVRPELFKDKIVLIGATDPLIHDEHLTPFGIFPGVAILANSVTMLLSGQFIHTASLWVTVCIVGVIGIIIMLASKHLSTDFFSFLLLTGILGLMFCFLYAGLLYMRSKNILFDYFGIFSLSFLSLAVSTGYKYSSFIYTSNRLRRLAILDSTTGFYTLRYFSLKLDEQLAASSRKISLIALNIANYHKVMLKVSFEQLQSFISFTASIIQNSFKKRLKKIIAGRLSQETFCIAIADEDQKKLLQFVQSFLKESEPTKQFSLKNTPIILRAALLHKPEYVQTSAQHMLDDVKVLLKELENSQKEDIICRTTSARRDETRTPVEYDMLDFLVTDSAARIKELEALLKDLVDSRKETEEAYLAVVSSLITALEAKDTYTEGHSKRVAEYARLIAHEAGLSAEQCDEVYKAGLLHDIGKIGIPETVLKSDQKLTDLEYEAIREHPVKSRDILKPIKSFVHILPMVLHHHERYLGDGYPEGLRADAIPQGAQILSVADAFDAMTSGRQYLKARTHEEALQELERCKGTQFNPLYVDLFRRAMSKKS